LTCARYSSKPFTNFNLKNNSKRLVLLKKKILYAPKHFTWKSSLEVGKGKTVKNTRMNT